jgi:hypothetical protein
MTVIQQRISLEYASTLTGDPEAHLRGYVDQQTIEDAQLLANACIQMPTFGQIGFLADVGEPPSMVGAKQPYLCGTGAKR